MLRASKTVALTVLSLLPVSVLGATASAASVDGSIAPGVYSFQNLNSSKCVDVPGSSQDQGIRLHQWTCHGGANQQFEVVPAGNHLYEIRAHHSGKCVDVLDWSTEPGGPIAQWECNGGENQRWDIQKLNSGHYQVVSAVSNQCFDVRASSQDDGADVIQYPCGLEQANQLFDLVPVSPFGH